VKEILRKIVEELSNVSLRCRTGNGAKPWTREIKSAICRIAKVSSSSPYDNKLYATNCDGADGGEWLFDLVWVREVRGGDWKLKDLILVMESEWSPSRDDQKYDFQKLIVAKARIKLFVFQEKGEQELLAAVGEFLEMAKTFRNLDESEFYIFAGCARHEDERFHFYCYDGAGKESVVVNV